MERSKVRAWVCLLRKAWFMCKGWYAFTGHIYSNKCTLQEHLNEKEVCSFCGWHTL